MLNVSVGKNSLMAPRVRLGGLGEWWGGSGSRRGVGRLAGRLSVAVGAFGEDDVRYAQFAQVTLRVTGTEAVIVLAVLGD